MDLRRQLYLPEGVDAFGFLDSLLVQVYHAFSALMGQPKSAYSIQARRWMGGYNRLTKMHYLLRDLMIQGAPPEAFDLCLRLEMTRGLSEWLEGQQLRPAA